VAKRHIAYQAVLRHCSTVKQAFPTSNVVNPRRRYVKKWMAFINLINEGESMKNYEKYVQVQNVAKKTMEEMKHFIKSGVTEQEIVQEAEHYMRKSGVDKFWYHNIGAFVFVGERTKLSISGREYVPSDNEVLNNDIVTVDLSPELDGCWGDYARTFIIHNGSVVGVDSVNVKCIDYIDEEWYLGLNTEEILHKEFESYIKPEMTLDEVCEYINIKIRELGFFNLDFLNNLGHTIETKKENRLYFESGNKTRLKEVELFTFEPHIMKINGRYGFKREDIYYFKGNQLMKL
jgi:methionine aminopeptidase